MIDDRTAGYLSDLAKVELPAADMKALTEELEKIIDYMGTLKQLDLAQIPEMSHPFPMEHILREDECLTPMACDDLLANAPEKKDGYFIAPKVME